MYEMNYKSLFVVFELI